MLYALPGRRRGGRRRRARPGARPGDQGGRRPCEPGAELDRARRDASLRRAPGGLHGAEVRRVRGGAAQDANGKIDKQALQAASARRQRIDASRTTSLKLDLAARARRASTARHRATSSSQGPATPRRRSSASPAAIDSSVVAGALRARARRRPRARPADARARLGGRDAAPRPRRGRARSASRRCSRTSRRCSQAAGCYERRDEAIRARVPRVRPGLEVARSCCPSVHGQRRTTASTRWSCARPTGEMQQAAPAARRPTSASSRRPTSSSARARCSSTTTPTG